MLSASSHGQRGSLMVSGTPGLGRIRAGIPKSWKAGEKSGTDANLTVKKFAVLWPHGRNLSLVATYLSDSTQGTEMLAAAHAEMAASLRDEQKIMLA
jgi:beta-lactamase class A